MIEIEYDASQFTRMTKFLLAFFPRVRKRLYDLAEEVMRETERDLKNAIINKDRSSFIKRLRSISPDWIDRKRAKGWKLHQLTATDQYANGIEFHRSNDVMSLRMRNGTYPGRKFSYAQLARFLEYGTKNMKPIPHWRRAAQHFREVFKKRVQKEFKHVRVSG